MKIYFAGSIRGGRDDQALYFEIIKILQNYGEVLTEHIGNGTLTNMGQTSMTDEEIYNKDTNWIKDADIIIAEVTTASLGVGYELGYAEALNKKIIALYRPSEGKSLSAMIRGNKNVICIDYQNVSELSAIFDKLLKQ